MENNINISYSDVVNAIKAQFDAISNGLVVYVDDEQNFTKMSEIKRNTIYVAVHFNEATVNFATSILPVTLTILGVENSIKPAQDLLYNFVNINNNTGIIIGTNQVYNCWQLWRTPVVVSNFIETEADFRSLFSVSGTILVGSNTIEIYKIQYCTNEITNEWEDINFLSFSDSLNNSLEPQPFLNTNGFAVSESKFLTYSFSINTYFLNTKLIKDVLRVKGFTNNENDALSSNYDFIFNIEWNNGFKNENQKFKLASCQSSKNIGNIPTITLAFTH